MNILHLNTHDISGGAARAAHRLHTGLGRLGHDSTMFVAHRRSSDPHVVSFEPPAPSPPGFLARLRRRLLPPRRPAYTRLPGYDAFSNDRAAHGPELLAQMPPADVINLHWVATFVDYHTFFEAVSRPVAWTLHDMNPFTGGCHYTAGCSRYNRGCGACPQLGSTDPDDLSRHIWQRKQDLFTRLPPGRLHLVALSRWMAEQVQNSALLSNYPLSIIPNGLDTAIFAPQNRAFTRRVLGLPPAARVLLFAAGRSDNHRKGFDLLAEALAHLDDLPDLFLLSVGSSRPVLKSGLPHMHLGHLANDRLLALAYSAADVLVIPSRQDNLPNTVLEAMACSTPVVGFEVGGIPDMVRPGVTGLLAPPEDAPALGRAIAELLADPAAWAEMSANCRRVAVAEYSLEVQARRYVELYETMLAG